MSKVNRTWLLGRIFVYTLEASAVAIAIPRTMGLMVAYYGTNVKQTYPRIVELELWSGIPLAILEGLAIAYLWSKWKQNREDKILIALLVAFVLTWPLVFAPHGVAEQDGLTVSELLVGLGWVGTLLRFAWTGLVATIPMLIVAGVGYADGVASPKQVKQKPKQKPSKPKQLKTYTCDKCLRDDFTSKQALGGHSRTCKGILMEVKQDEITST